jgi:hypothetical protein
MWSQVRFLALASRNFFLHITHAGSMQQSPSNNGTHCVHMALMKSNSARNVTIHVIVIKNVTILKSVSL